VEVDAAGAWARAGAVSEVLGSSTSPVSGSCGTVVTHPSVRVASPQAIRPLRPARLVELALVAYGGTYADRALNAFAGLHDHADLRALARFSFFAHATIASRRSARSRIQLPMMRSDSLQA
jgi:hypothetical protein